MYSTYWLLSDIPHENIARPHEIKDKINYEVLPLWLSGLSRRANKTGTIIFLNNSAPSSSGRMKLFYMDMVKRLLEETRE